MSTDLQTSTPIPTQNHVTTCASAQGPREEDTTPSFPQNIGTPPYMVREGTRIHALETTVQRMASDLTSSKEQIQEVKELLLLLIKPRATERESTLTFNPNPPFESQSTQFTPLQEVPRKSPKEVGASVPES
ncbi:hypothetical protein KC19_VG330700 [Ceratodon purpureus]|uniref:Uncharacterized protein n=1 Tax=Ceratodon purpureus TaxID=3225 RepID=A0A8T0HX59_CERPU|nr:hypothetical protein KC19_VG330700 [Ceratodon purpureus]